MIAKTKSKSTLEGVLAVLYRNVTQHQHALTQTVAEGWRFQSAEACDRVAAVALLIKGGEERRQRELSNEGS